MQNKNNIDNRKRTKTTITPAQLLELGKLPPQACEIEEVLLGAMLLDKDCLSSILNIITKPEIFYKPQHCHIFSAIKSLYEKADPVDILTTIQELKKTGELELAGGAFYVSQLTNRVTSGANSEVHARVILEKFLQRELIRISTTTLQSSYEDTSDIFELLSNAEQDLFSISNVFTKKNFEPVRVVAGKALSEIEAMQISGSSGLSTGFKRLDAIMGGWHKGDLIILAARPGMGKCLGKGTKIIMFDGSLKNVEDIIAGDLLMGVDSNPRKVLSTTNGIDKMYRVHQNKGIPYRVTGNHILSLKTSRNNYWYRNGIRHKSNGSHGDILNISVNEFLSKSNKFRNNHKGYKTCIEFKENNNLPLEPYFLGLWLGDGTAKKPEITNPDVEVINYIKKYTKKLGLQISYSTNTSGCPQMNITKGYMGRVSEYSMVGELKKLNLIGNKHIPNNYLINSHKNRMQLLAGLLDTDGHLHESNGYEIIQKNKILIEQIKFLCDSLGFRTILSEKIGKIKSIGFSGLYYRLMIFGDIYNIPLKIKRKKYKKEKNNHRVDWRMTGINVEFDKFDNYYGFELDGDGLFLLEDFTVTHNSSIAMQCARHTSVIDNKAVAVFSLEMTSTQLVMRLFSAEAEIPAEKIFQGTLSDIEMGFLNQHIGNLVSSPLYIDDTPALSLFEFRAKARRLKAQHDVQLIIVDYLQLMVANDGTGRSREQEVSLISRTLKAVAKELDVPIIALSQMSRAAEQRTEKKGRPQLSDLRESGAIEQDADIVMFVYRPDKMGYETDEDGNSTAGVAEIIIAKHRNGRTGPESFFFNEPFVRFEDNGMSNDPFGLKPQIAAMNQNKPSDTITDVPSSNITFEDEDENIGY